MFCEKPAEEGGATPVCRSDLLFEELERRRPDFVRECEEPGLLYSLVMPQSSDPRSGQGRSWRSTFSRETREGAEESMRGLGDRWEWLPDGCLRATTPVLPAVRRRSFRGERVVLASLAA